MEFRVDDTCGSASGDLCLPGQRSLGSDHPIPLVQDPSTCLGWLKWLSLPERRKVLKTLQERGPTSRRELTQGGIELDIATTQAAVRCGVLRMHEEKIDFQFATTKMPPEGKPWTTRPPRFWLTRTYEPLRCVQGSEEYLGEGKERSAMKLLAEMAEDGREVVPQKRKEHLKLNLLYEPAAVVPRIEKVGPGSLPSVWVNRRRLVYAIQEGYERAAVAIYLEEELTRGSEKASKDWRTEVLERLARTKVDRYLMAREQELKRRLTDNEPREYGLGTDAIMSLAKVELERDKLVEERKHFERFLEILME